jgi:predicted TIM-barrel fold metal-dependent hydrolase
LGHLGEMLPVMMWRTDHRLAKELGDPRSKACQGPPAKKKLDHYFRNNFYITTSGNFSTSALMNAIDWLGADRIMFAADSPWESVSEAANWFDNLHLGEGELTKIARTNAAKLLKWSTP